MLPVMERATKRRMLGVSLRDLIDKQTLRQTHVRGGESGLRLLTNGWDKHRDLHTESPGDFGEL